MYAFCLVLLVLALSPLLCHTYTYTNTGKQLGSFALILTARGHHRVRRCSHAKSGHSLAPAA
jgi:hypothetical protein